MRDQLKDYAERGRELEESNFLDFYLNTYLDQNNNKSPVNQWVPYIEGSRRENKRRIVRTIRHETMPNFMGQWFPRNNNPTVYSFYCASILALLLPWRTLLDLKSNGHEFESTFHNFKSHATGRHLAIMENIQYYHKSSNRSNKKRDETYTNQEGGVVNVEDETDVSAYDPSATVVQLTNDDIEIAR